MRKSIIFTVLLSLAAILPVHGGVRTIYISASGSDNGAGTADSPVASIEEVIERIESVCKSSDRPDTLKVRFSSGVYDIHKSILLTPSLNNGVPVVFEGEADGRTVISGGKTVAPFTRVNDKLWKTYIPEVEEFGFTFEQMYVNGQRRFRAQSPNRGEFNSIRSVTETILDSSKNDRARMFTVKIEPEKEVNLSKYSAGRPLITFYHNWNISKRFVLNQDDSGALYTCGRGLQVWNFIDVNSRFIVEDDRSFLDAPGEWFLEDDGWLYYIPCEGETPENVVCRVPVVKKLVVIKGSDDRKVENVSFRNISFEEAAYKIPTLGYNTAQSAAHEAAAIEADYARNIILENCTIAHTGAYGIWFRKACSESRVEHCHLYDLGAGGVKIGDITIPDDEDNLLTRRITIDNNIIQHGGFVFPQAAGVILFHTSDNRITHNDIADFRYTGVSVGWVWGYSHSPSKRNIIEYNHIHHLGWGELSDMGGVYTLGSSEGTSVSHNHVHHIYSLTYGGWGLYTDEGSSGVTLEKNLVYCCKSGGFDQHYGKDNIVRNNIFAGQILSQLEATRVEEHTSFTFERNIVYFNSGAVFGNNWDSVRHLSDYNCYFDTRTPDIKFKEMSFAEWQETGQDRHSVIADPKFVDAAGFDFTPKNRQMLRKIKFTPFDPMEAGVYGSDEWKKKAELDEVLIKAFDEKVRMHEAR